HVISILPPIPCLTLSFPSPRPPLDLHSFPTRRSSDLVDFVSGVLTVHRSSWRGIVGTPKSGRDRKIPLTDRLKAALKAHRHLRGDRKSTRLNSSHVKISYAVFCLKKKKNKMK